MMTSGTWNHPGYTTVEMLLDDVSKQMASSNLARYSRGQRTSGSTRVVKPSSASNSPRGSLGIGRRRTVMNDGAYRRRLAMLEQQQVVASKDFVSNDGLQVPTRSTRPMSWHPASQPGQHDYQQSNPIQTQEYHQHLQLFDMPHTPAAYSEYASPDSAFSPLSMPYTGYEQPQCLYQFTTSQTYQSQPQYITNQQSYMVQQTQQIVPEPTNTDPTMYSHFEWNNFATNGFESSSTAPPTPDNFLPIQHPEPAFSVEESIPYEPLEDSESGGEELIGMGLYDSPEPIKNSSLDPQLDSYRALMMSHLMGAGHRKTESTGKGLKLEETWEPPASDDEDDEDQDGEGEDDDIEEVPRPSVVQAQFAPHGWF